MVGIEGIVVGMVGNGVIGRGGSVVNGGNGVVGRGGSVGNGGNGVIGRGGSVGNDGNVVVSVGRDGVWEFTIYNALSSGATNHSTIKLEER
jgi:hypothetical protein